jgi:DEAD/DEAH box helicase domain-containing protein
MKCIITGVFGSISPTSCAGCGVFASFTARSRNSSAVRPPSLTPGTLEKNCFGVPFRLIDQNGAPRGEKHFIFYNLPVINEELGIRKSVNQRSQPHRDGLFLKNVQTIVFGRSRLRVESSPPTLNAPWSAIRRIPTASAAIAAAICQRTPHIEEGTRFGRYLGVSALTHWNWNRHRQLKAAVLAGYPGTIASTWQQGGRAGRQQETSVWCWWPVPRRSISSSSSIRVISSRHHAGKAGW